MGGRNPPASCRSTWRPGRWSRGRRKVGWPSGWPKALGLARTRPASLPASIRAAGPTRAQQVHPGHEPLLPGVVHRDLRLGEPDNRRRGADPDRAPGGGHPGVGAHRAVVAAGPRRQLRPRPGLPAQHRRACARAGRQRAGRGGVGRGHHGGGAGVGVHRARGPQRPGHDRRDHAVRQVLPVGGIEEKVLAAHRCWLARVVLPRPNRKQVDEDLGDDLRSAIDVTT